MSRSGEAPGEGLGEDLAADLAADLDTALVRGWYAPLAAGLVPVLLLGFAWSALADRLAFVGWALAAAAGYAVLLRHGIEAGWAPGRRVSALALWLALGLGAFAALEAAHQEILDLGFLAVLPGLYRPAATRPSTALSLAAVLLAIAVVAALAGRDGGAAEAARRPREVRG